MTLSVRRIVTGHDASGKAIVEIDETAKTHSMRPGVSASVIWFAEGLPANNDGFDDPTGRPIGTTIPNGSVFRVLQLEPGCARRMHRTDSIDYAIMISGELHMELDDGAMVHLNAGDVLVQRGTVHCWINNGTAPAVIAFVLISAEPVTVGGRTLAAHG